MVDPRSFYTVLDQLPDTVSPQQLNISPILLPDPSLYRLTPFRQPCVIILKTTKVLISCLCPIYVSWLWIPLLWSRKSILVTWQMTSMKSNSLWTRSIMVHRTGRDVTGRNRVSLVNKWTENCLNNKHCHRVQTDTVMEVFYLRELYKEMFWK